MTKQEWKSLTKKQQWDVLVALRGPDITNSEVIKSFTTGVIRKAMSHLIRVGGQLSDLGFVVLPSPGSHVFYGMLTGPIRVDLDHFALHTYEAADILGVPILVVPNKVWEDMVISQSRTQAFVAFCQWAQSHKHEINDGLWQQYVEPLVKYYGSGDSYINLYPPKTMSYSDMVTASKMKKKAKQTVPSKLTNPAPTYASPKPEDCCVGPDDPCDMGQDQ